MWRIKNHCFLDSEWVGIRCRLLPGMVIDMDYTICRTIPIFDREKKSYKRIRSPIEKASGKPVMLGKSYPFPIICWLQSQMWTGRILEISQKVSFMLCPGPTFQFSESAKCWSINLRQRLPIEVRLPPEQYGLPAKPKYCLLHLAPIRYASQLALHKVWATLPKRTRQCHELPR